MRALIKFKDGSDDWMDVPFGCRGSYTSVVRDRQKYLDTSIGMRPRMMPHIHSTVTCKWIECVRDAHGQITHDVFQE